MTYFADIQYFTACFNGLLILVPDKIIAQWDDNGDKISTSDNVEITNSKANTEVKLQISNTDLSGYSVIRFGDSSTNSGNAFLHRFNANWSSVTAMWEANSIGFYESIGSMNIGGKTAFKVFTGNPNSTKFKIDDSGNVGIGTINSDCRLSVVGSNAGNEVKLHLANTSSSGYSVIRFSDSERGNGLAYLHRFNSNWNSLAAMWEANSIGFYESVGSMNIGGKKSFKVFTGDVNSERLRINEFGNVLIGKTSQVNNSYKLDVRGTIRADEIKVNLDGADFVFERDYELMPLNKLEKYVIEYKHLPEIASAKEMEQNGTELGDLNSKLLQKIEEMTLYIIEQNKKIQALEAKFEKLESTSE